MDWWVPIVAPIPPVIVSFWLTRKRLSEIHILVNSRLQEALNEIEVLKTALPLSPRGNGEGNGPKP